MGIDKVNGVVEVYILNNIGEARKSGMLNLSFCNLVSLPDSLFELTGLEVLSLQHNYLSSLPGQIKVLSGLLELNLEMNQLETLPPEIGQLAKLKRLNLKNNRLASLPPEIGKLTGLIELDLSGNRLTALPPEIAELADLKSIYVQGNPLQTPPLEIVNRGMAAIIDYFKKTGVQNPMPGEKPDFGWNYERNLRFEYQYKRAAEKVFTPFIGRLLKEKPIETILSWKEGVILYQENTKALVTLDPLQSIITVLLDGPARKKLLGAIRKLISDIHQALGVFDFKEMVSCSCDKCSSDPYIFNYNTLKRFLADGQYKAVCAKSGNEISVSDILNEIEDLAFTEIIDIFEGWRPGNMGETKFLVQNGEVIVLHGNNSGSRYNSEQLNQIVYEIIKKKIQKETERQNMFKNLQIIKNPYSDKDKRQIAVGLFKVFITYLCDNGEQVLAGFLYEALRNLPLIN